jgi:hypothetical protein
MRRIFANCVVKEHDICGQPECGCPCHLKKETTVSVDPTAIANAALSSKSKKESTVTAAATTPAPTTSTTRSARPKLTWQEAKARRESARALVGYSNTSPIWGKTTVEVISMVMGTLESPTLSDAQKIADAASLLNELQKREAAEKIAFA